MWDEWGCLYLVLDCLFILEVVLRDLLNLFCFIDENLWKFYLKVKLEYRVFLYFIYGCLNRMNC